MHHLLSKQCYNHLFFINNAVPEFVTAFKIPVFSVRTTFRAFEYCKKEEAVKYSSKLSFVGLPNTLTNSCSLEINVISPTGPLVALKAYAPILVETAGTMLVKSFLVREHQ